MRPNEPDDEDTDFSQIRGTVSYRRRLWRDKGYED
jgi:hypothetical protein